MTIGYIILMVILGLVGIILSIGCFCSEGIAPSGFITLIITCALIVGMIFFGNWYYGSTASGMRALKDQQSNFNQGLNRQITITAEDGREIYHYKGKCDIETQDRYILFEGEDGLRRTIYWGITDTIIIEELGQ